MKSSSLLSNKKKLIELFAGFSTVGIVVTLFSMGLIYLFLKVLKTPLIITYILIYFASIIISYFLNTYLVYKVDKNKKQFLFYIIIYVTSMIIGVILLRVFQKLFPFENWILVYMVIPFTLVWNFVLTTFLLTQKIKNK